MEHLKLLAGKEERLKNKNVKDLLYKISLAFSSAFYRQIQIKYKEPKMISSLIMYNLLESPRMYSMHCLWLYINYIFYCT